MNLNCILVYVDRLLRKLSSSTILIIAIVGIAIFGIPDYFIGIDFSFSIFYILPLAISTWYAGKNVGVLVEEFNLKHA